MRSTQAGFKSGKGAASPADLLVQLGPTLKVDLGRRSRSPAGDRPDLDMRGVKALIDTGAGGDCIDEDLAVQLKLPVHDEGTISGVGGRHRAFIYTARLYIPSLDRLLFQPFTGVKLQQGDQWHGVILGRTFLRRYRLTYNGFDGSVDLSEAP